METTMKPPVSALLVLVGLLTLGALPVYPQVRPEPSADTLEQRVRTYYEALEKRDFRRVWNFFDPTMKRDNPITGYVRTLDSSIAAVTLVEGPKVSIETAQVGDTTRSVGKAVARITIRGKEDSPLQAGRKWDSLNYGSDQSSLQMEAS